MIDDRWWRVRRGPLDWANPANVILAPSPQVAALYFLQVPEHANPVIIAPDGVPVAFLFTVEKGPIMKQIRKKVVKPPATIHSERSLVDAPDSGVADYSLATKTRLIELRRARAAIKYDKRWFLPNTYVRIDVKTGAIRAFVTVMPGGLKVAWDSCRGCHNHIRSCTCAYGVQTPASIEHIYDSIVAKNAGEDFTVNHKYYRGSLCAANAPDSGDKPRSFVMPRVEPAAIADKSVSRVVVDGGKRIRKSSQPTTDELDAAADEIMRDVVSEFMTKANKRIGRKPIKKSPA